MHQEPVVKLRSKKNPLRKLNALERARTKEVKKSKESPPARREYRVVSFKNDHPGKKYADEAFIRNMLARDFERLKKVCKEKHPECTSLRSSNEVFDENEKRILERRGLVSVFVHKDYKQLVCDLME